MRVVEVAGVVGVVGVVAAQNMIRTGHGMHEMVRTRRIRTVKDQK